MKAQSNHTEQYIIAGTGKTKTLFLRENITEIQNEDGDTLYQYDEYRLDIRDRAGIEQYVADNFDALLAKAKQVEVDAITAKKEKVIDNHIDKVAAARGYGRDGIRPSVACIGYASYENEYQAEAIGYGKWVASLWPVVFSIMSDVSVGLRDIPTDEELISELPEMVWQ